MRAWTNLGGSFDPETARGNLSALEERMSSAGFWSDQESAQSVLDEVKSIKGWLDPYDKLGSRLIAAKELDEMLEMEDDVATAQDLDVEIEQIESEVAALELRTLLSGPDDF